MDERPTGMVGGFNAPGPFSRMVPQGFNPQQQQQGKLGLVLGRDWYGMLTSADRVSYGYP